MPYLALLARSRDLLRAGIQRLDIRQAGFDDRLLDLDDGPEGSVDLDAINAALDAHLAVMDTAFEWMRQCHEELIGDYFTQKDQGRP